MRKLPLVLVLVFVLVTAAAVAVRAFAPPDVTVTLHPLAARTVYGGEPDVLGLDFTIVPGKDDRLDAVVVKQDGTAQWQRDLIAAELWADAGTAGFQGIGVDRKIATGTWVGSENAWAFSRFDEPLPAAGARFFVTVDVYDLPTSNVTVALKVLPYRDAARAMEYDPTDRGIFVRTARPTPAAMLAYASAHTIIRPTADALAPVVRITEPADGASFARDWLVVRGVAQDVGGSAVAKVRLSVNRIGKTATWVDAVPEATGFTTWEARLFELPRGTTLELRVQAEDWIGNRSAVSAPRTVTLTE